MSIVLVGSNPGLLLFSQGTPVAAASLWMVDWSAWGHGTVLMMVDADGWRTVGTDEHLARILRERFNRHFPEAATFAEQRAMRHVDAGVDLVGDIRSGMHAFGGGLELRIGEIKDRRQFSHPAFPLGEVTLSLTNVYIPCALGELTVDGVRVDGEPHCAQEDGQWSSSSYLAVAEVWSDPTDELKRAEPMTPAATVKPRHLHAIGSH